jgi:hypothetical protein
VARPLIAAAAKGDAPRWWKSGQPHGANRECDLLGVDRDGGLVAIEVKPATASASSIAWSPIQARMYATFFQDWLDANRSEAAAIVSGMVDQRRRVGLSAGGRAAHLDVTRPVRALVAVDSRLSEAARTRMAEVIRHYDEVGQPLHVEVMSVNLIGRFRRLQL